MPHAPLVTNLTDSRGALFRILSTTARSQTATMTIPPGQEAGPAETHADSDQIIHVVQGQAQVRLWTKGDDAAPERHECPTGTLLVIPAGTRHRVKNVGHEDLFFLTVYSPPEY